jgi:hypothetical protein
MTDRKAAEAVVKALDARIAAIQCFHGRQLEVIPVTAAEVAAISIWCDTVTTIQETLVSAVCPPTWRGVKLILVRTGATDESII